MRSDSKDHRLCDSTDGTKTEHWEQELGERQQRRERGLAGMMKCVR